MNGGENVAKQIEGVYDKLIECAKAEFLEKGFKDASLRTIAKNAHTSTNSIYVRFGDKAGLFDALVKPHYETVMNRYIKTQTEFQSLPADIQGAPDVLYGNGGIYTDMADKQLKGSTWSIA